MAGGENEEQSEIVEQEEEVVEELEEALEELQEEEMEEETDVSRISVLSQSFEPRMSSIEEETDATSAAQEPARETTPSVTAGGPQYERIEKLARPKVAHLEETLERHGRRMKDAAIERIKGLISELRGTEKLASAEEQQSAIKLPRNSELIYKNLHCSLRKVAFETLANRIFDKMPELIVKMQHNRPQRLAPETKVLYDTLQVTLQCYLGLPESEHEARIFEQLCYGLTKFVENIIEQVHQEQQERDDAEGGKLRYPVAVELGRKAYKERQMRTGN
ncbi:uncharacterized protein LOC120896374 [Anopheles arabiensis]|uniref:Uncharacterized protein n=1 Tax=Anopheles arabiensis TaxID=7173 RepID=A0A2C9GRU0_ANOAR|nr:uncharacterized protein LOC120896374 [Anopheles arabiensis]